MLFESLNNLIIGTVSILLVASIIGCSDPSDSNVVSSIEQSETVEPEVIPEVDKYEVEQPFPALQEITTQEENTLEKDELADSIDYPATPSVAAEQPLPAPSLLKPTLPVGVNSEPILKSRPIPGKPIIAIYKIREGASPQLPKHKLPKPDIAPAVKPEPTIAITPEPTIVPKPEPVLEPNTVRAPLAGAQEQKQIVVVPKPEPQPVIQSDNVATAGPAESEPVKQPELEQPQSVVIETPEPTADVAPNTVRAPLAGAQEQTPTDVVETPEPTPVIVDNAPPYIEIASPPTGTFYTKKIQIEGKIASSAENINSVSGVGKVTWEIAGKKAPEEIFFGSDGFFFLSFSSEDYSGSLYILIKAAKEDGPSSQQTITLYDGNVSPELTLKSPLEGSAYGASIQISGKVVDQSAVSLNLNGPASLEYSLFSVDNTSSGEQVGGLIPVASDGSFSTVIFSDKFSGEQLVTLTVHGRNGKTMEKSVSIVESDSDIPGFNIAQSDDDVVLSWDNLPGIEEYNLFYADKGIDPGDIDGNKFANVNSPVQIKNFREGYLYRFQLEAVPSKNTDSDDETIWSDIKETVILNENTLKPVVTPGYQQISLVWLNIPGTNTFDILRKDDSENDYTLLANALTGSSYIDRNVEFGKKYSYKVRPSLEGSLLSTPVAMESLAFPEEKTVVMTGFGSSDLQGIEVAGSYIFLANGTGGVRIIDNSNSEKPLEIGRYQTAEAKDILVRGERAYIADGFKGLKILDINDPGNPILLGSRKTTDASKLAILDNTVFIADGRSGIKIMDISSERKPTRKGSFTTDFAKDLVLQDTNLIVADGAGGLKIIDATNVSNLKEISSFKCKDAVALAVDNGIAYVADKGLGVRIINISDTSDPIEISQIPLKEITDISVNKNYIFVSDLHKGLLIYEVSDSLRPVLFDTVDMEGASALTLNNGIIYLSNNEGFQTVESFTTGRSFVIAEYKTDGKTYNLTYLDHTLYLADHRNGVKIVDVSNPADSSSFSTRPKVDTSYAESVVGYGSKLLIADGGGGVVLGNIIYSEDGSQEIKVEDSIDLPGITKSLVVYNNKAYIAAREEGMHILDLGTKEIDTVYTGGSVQEISVNKDLILIADGAQGLKIYSNNEGKPELLSKLKLPNAVTIALSDNYAVVGGRDGFSVIDVSEPIQPELVSSFSAGWIEDIYLKSGYIYAAAGSEGLIVVDMNNPKDLVLLSTCKDVYAVGVEVENDLAFVADVDGFKVVRVLIPSWLR